MFLESIHGSGLIQGQVASLADENGTLKVYRKKLVDEIHGKFGKKAFVDWLWTKDKRTSLVVQWMVHQKVHGKELQHKHWHHM